DYTVLPTYTAMADAAVELADLCQQIQTKYDAGTLSQSDIVKAGNVWKTARKNWELSEAFLFGPAANHNIDPHIDSWPLDKTAMDNLLKDIVAGKQWDLTNNGGYGLIGFHALEYVLYRLTDDENSSLPHSIDYAPGEVEYMVAVANDLRDQCVCLEACWAGTDNISAAKQDILEEAELDYSEEYGWEMKHSGEAGSHFKTFQDAAQEIIQGCIDIADEVGNTKIGRPATGASDEDKNYIESPYSLNSIEDFADNIISIERSYFGTRGNNLSISAFIKSINPELDTEMRTAIDNALTAIRAIPEPFTKTATGPQAKNAVKVVGTDLVSTLNKVNYALTR
ncbi:MAG: hypothetical protein K2J18_08245, partial [Paramuribaculum sp.]|nr:hypothetical protein [Paramuribaculum sp.]